MPERVSPGAVAPAKATYGVGGSRFGAFLFLFRSGAQGVVYTHPCFDK